MIKKKEIFKCETKKYLNDTSFEHNCIKVMIRWKIYWNFMAKQTIRKNKK